MLGILRGIVCERYILFFWLHYKSHLRYLNILQLYVCNSSPEKRILNPKFLFSYRAESIFYFHSKWEVLIYDLGELVHPNCCISHFLSKMYLYEEQLGIFSLYQKSTKKGGGVLKLLFMIKHAHVVHTTSRKDKS